MNYSNEGLQAIRLKDQRISFLSIFSSLCHRDKAKETPHMQLFKDAIEINEALYLKYGFPELPKNVPTSLPFSTLIDYGKNAGTKDIPF